MVESEDENGIEKAKISMNFKSVYNNKFQFLDPANEDDGKGEMYEWFYQIHIPLVQLNV